MTSALSRPLFNSLLRIIAAFFWLICINHLPASGQEFIGKWKFNFIQCGSEWIDIEDLQSESRELIFLYEISLENSRGLFMIPELHQSSNFSVYSEISGFIFLGAPPLLRQEIISPFDNWHYLSVNHNQLRLTPIVYYGLGELCQYMGLSKENASWVFTRVNPDQE
jgi:hypothetical protein